MTAEPSMAHALSAFAVGLFFWTWVRRRDRPGVAAALLVFSLQMAVWEAMYGDALRNP